VPQPELSVATICTGNICRSPMAEVVLKHLIADDPELAGHVFVTSAAPRAGTWVAPWTSGRARRSTEPGIDSTDPGHLRQSRVPRCPGHGHRHDPRTPCRRAGTADQSTYRGCAVAPPDRPTKDLDVADPYYGGDAEFDDCLGVITAGGKALMSLLRSRLAERN